MVDLKPMFKNLNNEELIIGAIFPLVFIHWIGWWEILAVQLSALFWALSGSEGFSKGWRRLGCPLVVASCIFFNTHNPKVFFAIPFAFASLSIGYGTPTTQPLDSGSALGRFWFKRTRYYDFATRGTIYALLIISFLVFLL